MSEATRQHPLINPRRRESPARADARVWVVSLVVAVALFVAGATLPATAQAAGTWSVQNPTTATLNDVACPDTTHCWSVGAKGTIAFTEDGGATWSTQPSGTTNNLNSLVCPTATRCLAVGDKAGAGTNGAIVATTDGGATWSPQNSGTGNNLRGAACADANTCWAVGLTGTIIKTVNGGASWSVQTSGTTQQLNDIACPTTTTCYVVGNKDKDTNQAVVLVTTDGGATWTTRSSGTSNNLNEIACASATDCRTVGLVGTIRATTDGGATWTAQVSGTANDLYGITCTTSTHCRVSGKSGTIRASNDASTWSAQTSGKTVALNAVACVDANACWSVGATGTIIATTDGGTTWDPQTSGSNSPLRGASCISSTTCWAAGDKGTVIATSTGGESWLRQTSVTTKHLHAISCVGSGTCYAVGQDGTIPKTVNGGTTWSLQTAPTDDLYGVSCASTTTCVAVGKDGKIAATTNGTTWTAQTSGVSKDLNDVTCLSTTTCYAVGDVNGSYGVVLKTTNGGTTWSPQSSLVNQNLNGVACPGANNCWAVGQSGRITSTSDGSTWAAQISGTAANLNGVACADASTCWAVGNNTGAGTPATILGTTTGGSSWATQASNTTQQLLGVTFASTANGWAVGNAGTVVAYVDDSTPPDAPAIESAPASPGVDTAPAWAFSGEDGATFECRLDRGSDVISAWTPCSDEAGYDLTVEIDGTYTFSVRATDAAGNTGPESHSDYALDTTLPVAPTITSSPAAVTSSRTPSWSFTGEAGADFECRLDTGGGAVVFAWGPCTSPKSYPLIAQPDGDFTFSVRAVDAAGNAGPAATNSFTLDTLAPLDPTITAWPASPGDDTAPSWSFSAEAGATVECRLDRGNDVAQTWAACNGSEGYDLSSEPDGTYTFSVRATDAAGNVGDPATNDYELDTTAPDPPDVTSAPGSPSSDLTPTWAFTAEPGAAFECSVDPQGNPASAWAPCSSPATFDLSPQPNGAYTLSIRATDAAGNVSTVTTSDYTLDRTAVAAPTIDSSPPSTGSGRNPSWSFSAPGAASYECRLTPGSNPAWAWQPCTSAHSYDLTGAPDDTYTFSVRARDATNNPSAATSEDYTLDTQNPAPPTFNSLPPSPGNDQQPTWSISAESDATLECELTRGATPVAAWGCGSTASRDLSAEPDGTYTLSVRARDAAGNLSDPATTDYDLDTAAPVTGITSTPPSPRADRAPAWSFDAESGADYQCRLDRGGTAVAGWTACTSPHSFDLTAQPDGAYTFSVKATDEAGNTGLVTTDDYVLDSMAPAGPTITSSPASPAAGRSPSWSFTGEAGATLRCRLDRGPDTISGWAACSGVASYDLSGKPDATYTFSVQATDGALNPGPIETRNYTLDTTPPGAPTITSSPGAAGTSTAPGWSFSSGPGTTLECRLDRGTTPMSGWAPCSGSRDYDLTGEADGLYTFSVRATDAVGNVGASRTSDYELVTSPPPAPTFLSQPPGVGNTKSPAWSFAGSSGSTLECRLERGSDVVADWAPCVSPKSYDLTGKADGTYELLVRSVNAVGLQSPAVHSAYSLDTVAPAKPTVTASPASPGANATPAWSFSGDAGAAFECRLERGSDVISDWGACTSPRAFALVGRPDGDYDFSVRARDAAGNESSAARSTYELDLSVPGAPRVTHAPSPVGRDARAEWSFTADAGLAAECRLQRGEEVVSDWEPCSSPRAYDLADRPDGVYTVSFRTRNAAGTPSGAVASDYLFDRVAPAKPTLADSPPEIGNDRRPAWRFTAEAGVATECRLNEGREAGEWRPCTSPISFNLRGRRDGDYEFDVRAIDAAGNVSAVRDGAYELDTEAPAAPRIARSPGTEGDDHSPTWAFTGESGATFDCLLRRAGREGNGWETCTSPKRYDLPDDASGDYAFAARATDRAGNTGASVTSDYRLLPKARAGGAAPSPAADSQPPAASPAPEKDAGEPAAASPPLRRTGPDGPAEKPKADDSGGAPDSDRSTGRAAAAGNDDASRARPSEDGERSGGKPERKGTLGRTFDFVGDTVERTAEVVSKNADKSVFPMSLLLLVGGFVLLQGRIDRNDPKLALAPTQADTQIPFGPPVTALAGAGDPSRSGGERR